jgi:mutator protein MutT
MRAAAVMILKNQVLLIHRYRENREYFVFPGGGVEKGETPEQAVIREVQEETSIVAKPKKILWEMINPKDNRKHIFFLFDKFSGTPILGGEEAVINCESNKFILEWHTFDNIKQLTLYPDDAKELFIRDFCK